MIYAVIGISVVAVIVAFVISFRSGYKREIASQNREIELELINLLGDEED